MAKHALRAVRPLADNTMARVARSMKRYVLDAKRPFLVSLKGSDRRDSSADEPHPTVLVGGGHSVVVSPHIASYYSHSGSRSERTSEYRLRWRPSSERTATLSLRR